MADTLAWQVAGGMPQIVPLNDLAMAPRHALPDELADGQRLDRHLGNETGDDGVDLQTITPAVARMLDR
ncbi:MAG TPA: hypothetical protein VMT69_17480, partial [Kineosporiaceae bacterium]|nr:hypothetical protein [Kineosporiaceae bacterium]